MSRWSGSLQQCSSSSSLLSLSSCSFASSCRWSGSLQQWSRIAGSSLQECSRIRRNDTCPSKNRYRISLETQAPMQPTYNTKSTTRTKVLHSNFIWQCRNKLKPPHERVHVYLGIALVFITRLLSYFIDIYHDSHFVFESFLQEFKKTLPSCSVLIRAVESKSLEV